MHRQLALVAMRRRRHRPAVVFLVSLVAALVAVAAWEHGLTERGTVDALGSAVAVTLGIRAGQRRRERRPRAQE